MGGFGSRLPRDLLGEYQELTFLTKQEILLAHRRFSDLLPKEEREQAFLTRVPKSKLLMLPELRANPFRHRICHVFSTAEDGEGSMSFEDFLDMLSVFSDSATLEIKSHYYSEVSFTKMKMGWSCTIGENIFVLLHTVHARRQESVGKMLSTNWSWCVGLNWGRIRVVWIILVYYLVDDSIYFMIVISSSTMKPLE
ncbi:hypothetical protein JRQ81_002041 [Phrynocephalus forsythii]|uniref:Uncharacterized protein n=1 Tax=Phrynocephalus forsythii TaxID=171643 RepID=A0A9Q0XH68_9SAUR|nr:hypothetical protein JRQ81_002041 [Phrynocephalus forsythii]